MIPDMVETQAPPMGCTWERYLEQLVREHGGWTSLAQLLIRRAGQSVELPHDPGSIERALRRLKARGNAPGGQYGRWLLRYFGVPRPLEDTARWMGQYHGRFADLPLSLREGQLWLWDRPPIAESTVACWIHLGLASVALRRNDLATVRLRLSRAGHATQLAAQVEAALLEARLAMDAGRAASAADILARTKPQIAEMPRGIDRDCYHARWVDQRAYHQIHAGPVARLSAAVRLYRSIDARSPAPFALFRRDHGLAYCHWKLGDHRRSVDHARAAVEHAGDAGLLRFRAMALDLLACIEPREARALRHRASRIAAELELDDVAGGGAPSKETPRRAT
jgi:hypothetical protein